MAEIDPSLAMCKASTLFILLFLQRLTGQGFLLEALSFYFSHHVLQMCLVLEVQAYNIPTTPSTECRLPSTIVSGFHPAQVPRASPDVRSWFKSLVPEKKEFSSCILLSLVIFLFFTMLLSMPYRRNIAQYISFWKTSLNTTPFLSHLSL